MQMFPKKLVSGTGLVHKVQNVSEFLVAVSIWSGWIKMSCYLSQMLCLGMSL